jgi:hypothetical protein
MSDITHSRRATEFIEYHDAAEDGHIPGEELIKAGVHASLATARALREIDTTTRQVNRLTADSIDELARDLRDQLRRPTLLVKLDDIWVNPLQVSCVQPHTEGAAISMAGGRVFLVRTGHDAVAGTLSGAVS